MNRADAEVARLIEAAKGNRYGHRDATMFLMAYRHGFRPIELVDLRWDQIDFDTANLAVRRAKKGSPSTHPITGDEMRALRRLQREQEPPLNQRLRVDWEAATASKNSASAASLLSMPTTTRSRT